MDVHPSRRENVGAGVALAAAAYEMATGRAMPWSTVSGSFNVAAQWVGRDQPSAFPVH